MRVALYNLESKYRNLALEKLRLYHQSLGDMVEDYIPLKHNQYDKIYASSIFTFTPKTHVRPDMIYGGTGFDLTTKLPPEIEATKPHLDFGYTTRGCPNNCPFCVVRTKEGDIHIEGDIEDIWSGKPNALITLLDNNALALIDHFELCCKQAHDHNLMLDWNQGLDHRKLTQHALDIIKTVRHKELRFAFDHPSYLPNVEKAIDLLQANGINRCLWYVLVGFNTTLQEDLDRLNYLRSRNQNAYVQRYKKSPEYIPLAEWANQHHIFYAMTWEQFLDHPKNKKYHSMATQWGSLEAKE